MRKGLLGSFLALLAGGGWAFGEVPAAGGVGHGPDPMPAWVADDARGSVWTGHGDGGGSTPCAWASVDYLLWWTKDGPLPFPLVLTGPVDPANDNPGSLDKGGFPILTGKSIEYGALSGARVTAGGWLDSDGTLGIEGSGFLLPRQSKSFRAASDANGNPVLGFNYSDPPENGVVAPDIFQASIPAGSAVGNAPFRGSLAVVSDTRLWGAEANAVAGLGGDGSLRLQALAGFRYVDLAETVSLQLQSTAIDGGSLSFLGTSFPAPSSIATTDAFRTRNQFYGGQVGVRGEYCLGSLVVSATSKIALGNMHEVVEVRGTSTLVSDVGAVVSVPSGQFAGPSNIGRRTRDEFAYVPEFEIKVGYQVSSCLRATVGYDFLYINRVVRPGNQIDLIVDNALNVTNGGFTGTPGTVFPRPLFNRSEFWAQGLTFGLELRF